MVCEKQYSGSQRDKIRASVRFYLIYQGKTEFMHYRVKVLCQYLLYKWSRIMYTYSYEEGTNNFNDVIFLNERKIAYYIRTQFSHKRRMDLKYWISHQYSNSYYANLFFFVCIIFVSMLIIICAWVLDKVFSILYF